MLTMMVTAFVMVLLGAFISLNQGQINLMSSSQTGDALERASQTVYEYCFSRLEHNKYWGAQPFDENRKDLGVQSVMVVEEINGTTRIKGETNLDDAAFEVLIRNNISGETPNAQGVPAHACLLDIEVSRGGLKSKRRIQLNTAPLYDASAVASDGMVIDTDKLVVASKDPQRNVIRSKQDLHLKGTTDLEFQPAPNSAEQGILWSGKDIILGNESLRMSSDARESAAETGGRFVDNSRTDYNVHDLKREEINIAKYTRVMGDGIYVFGTSDVTYSTGPLTTTTQRVSTLERREHKLVDGKATIGDVKEMWYYGDALPDDWVADEQWITTDGNSDWAFARRVNSRHFQLYEGDELIKADLSASRLEISANVDVQVKGDFGIFSEDPSITPSLAFIDQEGMGDRGSLSSDGEILIEGVVTGTGNLIANGSVSLYPNVIDVETDTQSDLSIYSGKNVRIAPPDNWTGQGTLSFKGLVYAKENVELYHQNKVRVEGAIVAREGHLRMTAPVVELVYNPDYLDTIVRELPDAQVRLERAVWIP